MSTKITKYTWKDLFYSEYSEMLPSDSICDLGVIIMEAYPEHKTSILMKMWNDMCDNDNFDDIEYEGIEYSGIEIYELANDLVEEKTGINTDNLELIYQFRDDFQGDYNEFMEKNKLVDGFISE